MGDVLVLLMHPDVEEQVVTKRDSIVKITATDGTVLGYNFFDASKYLPKLKDQNGQVTLDHADVDQLNAALKAADFDDQLSVDDSPKFVVGYVESVEKHPKSDHLKITKTKVQDGKTLQIVSGSPNMQADIKVVVAEVGTMMPSGLVIWPGELKGVESDGMICSGRELKIPNAPQKPGALILPDDYQVGTQFDFARAQNLFS
ncbi:DUF4479 and tRNA-binding domain-containing protein [Nicoliella spurrieriana]|uniref:DUF4479 and tRNA-binding domain-containing protein n=2 Tax=Nicoliella spurrieriana TaxID=2925830 RepID=A0A976X5Z5_9LACO|nr:DUF4479 and tRNA-binding domain-containing protein [Nicoliella spurrieriana]UQS87523.1 DUF4479 and tRNA-binding domain-containing protein [Nicoliella spurrieriana]